jgi:hypothetical protein
MRTRITKIANFVDIIYFQERCWHVPAALPCRYVFITDHLQHSTHALNFFKKIDGVTKNITRFLSTPGYGLIENATNLEASAAVLADEIIDLEAKRLGLGTTLDSPYSDKVKVFNIENITPGMMS